MIAMRLLNASVLLRKALHRNLSWGFPSGNLLPKTRVLKHRVLERKRRPNANASVLGTQRFRTLRPSTARLFPLKLCKLTNAIKFHCVPQNGKNARCMSHRMGPTGDT